MSGGRRRAVPGSEVTSFSRDRRDRAFRCDRDRGDHTPLATYPYGLIFDITRSASPRKSGRQSDECRAEPG
jgi:hypothetical protein